jgi:hypothetical protein
MIVSFSCFVVLWLQLCCCRPTSLELLALPGSVCSTKRSYDFLRMVSFQHVDVHYTRMFLELYFDRPLLVRSFFHKCADDESSYLFIHELMPTTNARTLYVKRHVLAVTQQMCFMHIGADFLECSKNAAIEYANHVALVLKAVTPENVRVIDDVSMRNASYAAQKILEMGEISNMSRAFDRSRVDETALVLSDEVVSEKIKQAGSVAPHEFSEANVMGTLDERIDILALFAKEFTESLNGNSAILQLEFPEVGFGSAAIQARISKMIDAEKCSTDAIVEPNVNVMIPTKNPEESNIARCVDSLLSKANLTFGRVRFHFGIDWRDQKTQTIVEKTCSVLGADCEVHPVHGREGDVSAIANHIFATIDANEYFFRFNDDSEMLTQNWNVLAVTALRKPPCNIGIAHILDKTNPGLQTHSFVSVMHKRIFGFYFAYHFKNWYEDNWITDVYSGALTKKSGVVIKHHAQSERYVIPPMDHDALAFAVQKGRKRIDKYLLNLRVDTLTSRVVCQ